MPRDKWITIGIVQLTCHPAAILMDCDLLAEPFLPPSPAAALSMLGRYGVGIEPALNEIRNRYISWLESRVGQLLDTILAADRVPDIIILPECSVPAALLPMLRDRARRTGATVFAGTHSPSVYNEEPYRKCGIAKRVREKLFAGPLPPAVLPILGPKSAALHQKARPAIFERTDFTAARSDPVIIHNYDVETSAGSVSTAVLVCAEALGVPSYRSMPDFAVIAARERTPKRFEDHIGILGGNRIPVALCNDGLFGGSGVFFPADTRHAHWWYDAPFNGVLPTGDAYLEMAVNLAGVAPEMGVSDVSQQFRLTRLCPILNDGSKIADLEQAAYSAAAAGHTSVLRAQLDPLRSEGAHAVLVRQRWELITRLMELGTLNETVLAAVGSSVVLTGVTSLMLLEHEFAVLAERAVAKRLQSDGLADIDDKAVGVLAKTRRALSQYIGSRSASTSVNAVGRLQSAQAILDRETERREVREFIDDQASQVFVSTGLEGVGKSAVIRDGLAQAGVRVLVLTCVPGTSADFLFEAMHHAAGRIPAGHAPRDDFRVVDLIDCLAGVDVVWFVDAHNITRERLWITDAISRLISRLLDAQRAVGRLKYVFESRRAIPLDAPLGVHVRRRRVQGLGPKDATALIQQQLRRVGLDAATVDAAAIEEIAQAVSGHPGMLFLCAEVCEREGTDAVLEQLRGRRGFYMTAVRQLLDRMQLREAERRVLHALAECRRPVPAAVLDTLLTEGDRQEAVGELIDACLIERTSEGQLALAAMLRGAGPSLSPPGEQERRQFHALLADHFAGLSRTGSGLESYYAGFEANYHAAYAGLAPVCDTRGVEDAVIGIAAGYYRSEEYDQVARVLEPLISVKGGAGSLIASREDAVAMLAEAYGWTNQFEKAFALTRDLVQVRPQYASIFLEIGDAAMRSRQYPWVRDAIAQGAAAGADESELLMLRGRLAEKAESDLWGAISSYRAAIDAGSAPGWCFFYLGRALFRVGELEDALDVLGRGRDIVAERDGAGARNLENALLSQEMMALAMNDEWEPAEAIARVLATAEDPRPEAVLLGAYVRAYVDLSKGRPNPEHHLDDALAQLKSKDSGTSSTKAQLALFKGKLSETRGYPREAMREYEMACQHDPYNMHMKLCLKRSLLKSVKAAKSESERRAYQDALERVERDIGALKGEG